MKNNHLKLRLSEELILEVIRNRTEDNPLILKESWLREKPLFYSSLPSILRPYVYKMSQDYPELFVIHEKSREFFYEEYIRNIAKTEKILQAIKELSISFSKKNIDLLFLKGAALILSIYKDEFIRTMSDVDILIDKSNLMVAEETLFTLGYVRHDKVNWIPFHHVFIKDGLVIELHWAIDRKTAPGVIKEAFRSQRTIDYQGINISVPSNEVSAFIACVNLSRTYSEPFAGEDKNLDLIFYRTAFFLYELKRIILSSEDKFYWQTLIDLTESSGNIFEIFTLILLADKIVGVGLPKEALNVMEKRLLVRIYLNSVRKLTYLDFNKLFLVRECMVKIVNILSLRLSLRSVLSNIYQAFLMLFYLNNFTFYSSIRKLRCSLGRGRVIP
jgi:hypothetical protein